MWVQKALPHQQVHHHLHLHSSDLILCPWDLPRIWHPFGSPPSMVNPSQAFFSPSLWAKHGPSHHPLSSGLSQEPPNWSLSPPSPSHLWPTPMWQWKGAFSNVIDHVKILLQPSNRSPLPSECSPHSSVTCKDLLGSAYFPCMEFLSVLQMQHSSVWGLCMYSLLFLGPPPPSPKQTYLLISF